MSKVVDLEMLKITRYSDLTREIGRTEIFLRTCREFYRVSGKNLNQKLIQKEDINQINLIRRILLNLIKKEDERKDYLIKKRKALEESLKYTIN